VPESVLNGEALNEDKDNNVRPLLINDFQGQKALKQNLTLFIKAARKRNEALDHTFISGPPGLGKTTLAGIIAHEMQSEIVVTSAPALDKPKDLAGLLTSLNEKSVFFIDEIHRLKPAIEEMLYIAMEDFELDFVIGAGAGARTVRIPIPRFTLAGATTKPGRVSAPLHTRFGITLRIDFYTPDELKLIILRSAAILNIEITDEAASLLARCSRGTPRVANRLLRRTRDFAQIEAQGVINTAIANTALQRLHIDMEGLELQDRAILKTIIENYSGGPVGVETLAIAIGESTDSLEDFYEPYLVQQGFIQRTPRGRTVTAKAYGHLGLPLPNNKSADRRDELF
jgi:Holliday junction DNA helicase RuvB